MSNHHSNKSINLHHNQVNAGRERRQQRQADRVSGFLTRRHEARMENLCVIGLTFICSSYTMIATAVYLGYIL